MAEYRVDFALARRMTDEIQMLLGRALFFSAPFVEDTQHATDFMVYRAGEQRIAARVRRHDFERQNSQEITIRSWRPNGRATEMQKILAGWGDYLIYGWLDSSESHIRRWCVCDLAVLRDFIRTQRHARGDPAWLPGTEVPVRDGSAKFRAFRPAEVRVWGNNGRIQHCIIDGEGYGSVESRSMTPPAKPLPRADQAPRSRVPMQLDLWGDAQRKASDGRR